MHSAHLLSCEFVIFLDHDDLWERDALELLREELRAHPGAAAANGLARAIDAEDRRRAPGELEVWGRRRQGVAGRRIIDWPQTGLTVLAVLAFRNYIYTPGLALIRRPALEAVGPFDAACSPCDDWDMWLRLSRQGGIAYVDRVVLNWRAHGSNASADAERLSEREFFVRRKLTRRPDLTRAERRLVLTANWHWWRLVSPHRLHVARRSLAGGQPLHAAREAVRVALNYSRCRCGLPPG
jgi:GT2 family glycosyltransferase